MDNSRKTRLYDYVMSIADEANKKYALAEKYNVENPVLSECYVKQAFKLDDQLRMLQEVLSIVDIKFELAYRDNDDSIIVRKFEFEKVPFRRAKNYNTPEYRHQYYEEHKK